MGDTPCALQSSVLRPDLVTTLQAIARVRVDPPLREQRRRGMLPCHAVDATPLHGKEAVRRYHTF